MKQSKICLNLQENHHTDYIAKRPPGKENKNNAVVSYLSLTDERNKKLLQHIFSEPYCSTSLQMSIWATLTLYAIPQHRDKLPILEYLSTNSAFNSYQISNSATTLYQHVSYLTYLMPYAANMHTWYVNIQQRTQHSYICIQKPFLKP